MKICADSCDSAPAPRDSRRRECPALRAIQRGLLSLFPQSPAPFQTNRSNKVGRNGELSLHRGWKRHVHIGVPQLLCGAVLPPRKGGLLTMKSTLGQAGSLGLPWASSLGLPSAIEFHDGVAVLDIVELVSGSAQWYLPGDFRAAIEDIRSRPQPRPIHARRRWSQCRKAGTGPTLQGRKVGSEDRRRRSGPFSTNPATATAPCKGSCRCRKPDRGCECARAPPSTENLVFQLHAQWARVLLLAVSMAAAISSASALITSHRCLSGAIITGSRISRMSSRLV